MAIEIREMNELDIPICAAIACASVIGERYGFSQEVLTKRLKQAREKEDILLVAHIEKEVAGFAWIDPHGAFSSAPYLRLIAVSEFHRGQRIGSILLEAFESRTYDMGKDYFLLVSDFNENAIHFYIQHGYHKRGALPDFAKKGICEIIMVKKREVDAI